MPQQNNEGDNKESESMVLDLETLSAKYKNYLIEYQLAIANYVNYLKEEAETPCGRFNSNSTGVNQRCYDEIWKKSGCTTSGVVNASTSWAQGMTLNGLINDSWYWATLTDYNHRMGCYGNAGNPYIILCVGQSGHLWSRQGLDAPWQLVNDDSNGNIRSICTGNDGKKIYCTNRNGDIWFKNTWDSKNWIQVKHDGSFKGIAAAPDGSFICVGQSGQLWTVINGKQTNVQSPGESEICVALAPDGSVFVSNSAGNVYKKNSYINLPGQQWQSVGSCCVKSITIAPDGTFIGAGTDNRLYTKPSYKDLSTSWQGPYDSQNSSCCAVSITTVANPNYNPSNYNQTSQPNYSINKPNLTTVPGSTFWGTTAIGQNNSATLQECVASCSETNGCTGATYNQTDHGQPMCWLRGGEGDVVGGLPNDYAIVPKHQLLLKIVQDINQKLTSVNEEIQKKTDAGQPLYNSQSQQRGLKTTQLINQFVQLSKERDKINKSLKDFQTLDQEQIQGNIMINQNYYSFLLLLGLAVIVLFILYKFGLPSSSKTVSPQIQSGGELGTNAYYIVFSIILVILFLKFIINRYSL